MENQPQGYPEKNGVEVFRRIKKREIGIFLYKRNESSCKKPVKEVDKKGYARY
jgi:hypothetical protein